MHTFSYVKATSLKQVGELLAANADAKLLAGGMTLIPTMKARLAQPSHLIDIAGIAELSGIEVKDGKLTIGAATKHVEVAKSAVVKKAIPALAYLASHIGDPQVRARGTLGGSLANNDPSADYPSAALALQAQIITDRRTIEADDFFLGMFATALHSDEVVTGVRFRTPQRCAYAKFKHPASGYAMAGVFVAQYAAAGAANGGWRVAVTGVANGVFRWHEAEQALAQGTQPPAMQRDDVIDDVHAPAAYRTHLALQMLAQARQSLT